MGQAKTPPELPKVTDEAGDTPTWVPLLGILLFAIAAGWLAFCHGGQRSAKAATVAAEPTQ